MITINPEDLQRHELEKKNLSFEGETHGEESKKNECKEEKS